MSEPSTSAPAPSTHIFLHDLLKLETGRKVRFLCYVRDYDSAEGHLLVEHAYPPDAVILPRAYLDVNLVLDSAKRELMHDGKWLNVIGYVRSVPASPAFEANNKQAAAPIPRPREPSLPVVQAILLWDAGAIDVRKYEMILREQTEVRAQARSILAKAHEAIENDVGRREKQTATGKR